MTLYDAWTISKLLVGDPINGELRLLSPSFKDFGSRLARLDVHGRGQAFSEFVGGRADIEAILRVMDGADPTGPPPEPDAEAEGEDWPPLRLRELPPVEPFPVDVLPKVAARLVTEGAEAIGCPVDFLAVPVLTVAGGVIGRSVSLMLKPGYFASALLYAGNIGPPSDGKTPAQRTVASAVRRIDATLERDYKQLRDLWEVESTRVGSDGKKVKPNPPPRPKRIDVDDITMEAVPVILADSPRGVIMLRDEMTSLLLGMNQFKSGKGNDRPNLLKIWAGEGIKKDRVGHEANVPIRCPHPFMAILGGLTPDMLGSLFDPKGRSDGFVDRFLLAYPDPLPVPNWSERGVPEDTESEWCELVARLWARPMNSKDGEAVPHVIHFTPEGKASWKELYGAHAAEMNAPDFPSQMRGPWGKLREYAGRLALILACLDHTADPTAASDSLPSVGPRIVHNAWRLVSYFKGHTRRVHAAAALGPGGGGGPVARAIVSWLRERGTPSFKIHDLKQARRWVSEDELTPALEHLIRCHVIRPEPLDRGDRKAGRPSSPVYEVNPALLAT